MKSDEKKARRKFTAVAKALGISENLLHAWVTRHRLSEGSGAVPAEPAAEIVRLKRMLAQKDKEAATL